VTRGLLPQRVEHPLHVPAVGPAGGGPAHRGAVLDGAAGQRPGVPQPGQDVAAEVLVRLEPASHPRVLGHPVLPHHHPVNRVILGQHDRGGVGPVLEQPALPPQQRVEVGPVERAQPAPQDEQVAARHHVDRVELQYPQAAQHLPQPVEPRRGLRGSGTGQVLAPDGQPPGLPQRQPKVIRHVPILQDPSTERVGFPSRPRRLP